jgi:ABC-type transport system involved in cytochrome bd biosynthesis fused ATPase/permease subunit
MARVTNDDLEQKIDTIKAALGIQTATTSGVVDNIMKDLGEIKSKLIEADNKSRKISWLANYYVPGIALIAAAIIGCASIFAAINPACARYALYFLLIIFVIGIFMILCSISQIMKK